jgi:CO/xanthine dehydrogenase FAD-binding subunit
MDFFRPTSLTHALEIRAEHPDALCIQGGTDVMVELNFDRKRPPALIDLSGLSELRQWSKIGSDINLGAGVSYTRICTELGEFLPGLAMASRTVGSLQIRNQGGVGGNLGGASPAGDSHPPLLATGALVHVASIRGERQIAIDDFYLGPKRNALANDELITSIQIPITRGGEQFTKIGTRNAMVIAVCSFAIAIDHEHRRVGAGIGSAGPTPIRPRQAETFIEGVLNWDSRTQLTDSAVKEFGRLVSAAAKPIDDVRGTAVYRRYVLGVIAQRTLKWAWDGAN